MYCTFLLQENLSILACCYEINKLALNIYNCIAVSLIFQINKFTIQY